MISSFKQIFFLLYFILERIKYTERCSVIMKYQPKGVCSSSIDIEVENGVIKFVEFFGGCNGNLKGISALVTGMKVEDAIARLKGIRCGFKTTSCPDQLAQALEQIQNGN